MAQGIELRSEAQRSLAAASIGAAYANIGTPLARIVRVLIVQNYTDALLQFSFADGVDHFVLPAGGQLILDVTTNEIANSMGFFISKGTQLQVKEIGTPTTGAVYVSTFYASAQ